MARKQGNKPVKDAILSKTSFEHFRNNNKRIASKAISNCLLTDAEKVRNGTHKWVREGKTARLVRIENPL